MIENLLNNKFTLIAGVIAMLGGLLSDFFGFGFGVVFVFVVIFMIVAFWDEKKSKAIYSAEVVPIPLIINISNPTDSHNALNQLFHKIEESKKYKNHKRNLDKYFNIVLDDLIFKYNGDIFDEAKFVDFIKIVRHDIEKIEKKTPKNVEFHIAYIGPIANAIVFGSALGTKAVKLYQFSKSSSAYQVSFAIEDRKFKEDVDNYTMIEVTHSPKTSSEVTIAIELSSHKISNSEFEKGDYIYITNKTNNSFETNAELLRVNQEVFKVINEAQQKYNKIRLLYSMPVTIGISLGMSMQTYWNIELTQFGQGEYKMLLKRLDRIQFYY